MKMLVIGMDGAHAPAFRRGWTPFIESLLDEGEQLRVHEDLVSRGWAEIITGEHASVTGAVYDRPNLDGTHGWSQRFTLEDIPGIGEGVKPVWQVLNERGARVGIMNVPTAVPASAVDGFFVSGGGGGRKVVQDPTEELCHPRSLRGELLRHGYIVDERLNTLLAEKGLFDPHRFFGRLSKMNEVRTNAFVDLADRYEVDFGFLVYKSSSNSAEFVLLPGLEPFNRQGRIEPELHRAAEKYYRHFDSLVKRLVEGTSPAEVLLVSDHGMAARRWSFNPNTLLQTLGFQVVSRRQRGWYDLVKMAKMWIPYRVRRAIRGTRRVKAAYESMTVYDEASSVAFSKIIGDWNAGIFINDRVRFGGPVEAKHVAPRSAQVADAVNAVKELGEHGIHAKVREVPLEAGSPHFPDVVLSVPDGYMTSNESTELLSRFTPPSGSVGLRSLTQGRLLCGKASNALACCVRGSWGAEVSSKGADLTAVYRHILSRFP